MELSKHLLHDINFDVARMAEVLEIYGEFALGEQESQIVAKSWIDKGFSIQEVWEWLEARCFDPLSARHMADVGVKPYEAAQVTEDGLGEYIDSLGYKYSNGDMSLADVQLLVGFKNIIKMGANLK